MSTLPLFGRNGGENGDPEGRVYRVGQLNRMARLSLEDRFRDVWVEGELSDVSRAASGHIYFTLNDEQEQAQVRGVMFRSDARRAKAEGAFTQPAEPSIRRLQRHTARRPSANGTAPNA